MNQIMMLKLINKILNLKIMVQNAQILMFFAHFWTFNPLQLCEFLKYYKNIFQGTYKDLNESNYDVNIYYQNLEYKFFF